MSKEELTYLLTELGVNPKILDGRIFVVDYVRQISIEVAIDEQSQRIILTTFFNDNPNSPGIREKMLTITNLLNQVGTVEGFLFPFSTYSTRENGEALIHANFPLNSSSNLDKENFMTVLFGHIVNSRAFWDIVDSNYLETAATMETLGFFVERVQAHIKQLAGPV